MPIVPVIDPSTNSTPAVQAPSVAPMQDHSPEQIQRLGATIQQAGEASLRTTQTIGLRIQEQVDDAKTKAAETNFLQSATDVLNNPDTGYLHTRGENAQSQFGAAQTALAKAAADQKESLDNDIQKHMFQQVAQRHLVNFGTQLADHRFQQVSAYSAKSANDRSDSYVQLAANAYASAGQRDQDGNPTGDFNANWQLAVHEAQTAAKVQFGAAPESPAAKALVKEKTTAIVQGAIVRMMDDHQYAAAKHFYDDQLKQGNIDEQRAEVLGRAIKANLDQDTVESVGNQKIDELLRKKSGVSGGINAKLPIAGGSITSAPSKADDGSLAFAVPANTAVQAAADGKVVSVSKDDESGTYSVAVQHSNGYATTYRNLAAVNAQEGQQIGQGQQLGLTGKGGLQYQMAGKDGSTVDPAKQTQAPVDRTTFTNPADAQQVVNQINGSDYAPYLKREMVNYVESMQRKNLTLSNENYRINVKQPALDYYFTHNESISGLPANIRTQLKPEDLYSLTPKPSEQESNLQTWYGFATKPDTITVDNVRNAYVDGKLSKGDFRSLTERAMAQQNKPEYVQEAGDVATRIDYFAAQAGLPVYDGPGKAKTPEQKAQIGALHYKVQNDIDSIKAQNKGKITSEQVDQVIKKELTQQTLAMPRSPFSPMAILGNKTYEQKKFGFEIPRGAAGQVRNTVDGKMHWTDETGKLDLGVAE